MTRKIDFQTLEIDQKVDYIWNKGEFIKERKKDGCRVLLFTLDHNFVELWYHIEENKIDDIRIENSSDILALYLEDFKLNLNN